MGLTINIITEPIKEMTQVPKYTSEYFTELEERLREAHDLARKHLKRSAERQKILYTTNVKRHNYERGDLVWRNQLKNTQGLTLKIARQWTGPWAIIDKKSDIIFKIHRSKNSIAVIIYGDNLKPYKGNKRAKWFKENNEERLPVEIPNLTEFSISKGQQNDKKSDTKHPLITVERDDDVKSTQEEEIGNEMKDVITDSNGSDNISSEPAEIDDNYLDKARLLLTLPGARRCSGREEAKEQAKRASHETGNRDEVKSPRKKAKVQCNVHGPVASTSGSPISEQSENSASATKQDTYVDFIDLYADSSEFNSNADKTCSLIPETETEDTFDELLESLTEICNEYRKKDSDISLDEQTMETELLPGPSGLCSTKEKPEIKDVTETVETTL
ncbi:unnamed protein product [Mytilus coruscus]|uniref:Uncharacterized protein n=1 Tax=Mytilus coruscus TaxID=42192 RepID=A0A6J8B7N9_MYTCO|nr:unnamed protein product [Mytilus coruscus]